jgi:ribosomal protein S12 methylthiotransferase
MVSLGCPKNQVDAEQMLGVLSGSGFEITPDQGEADVIVVNTCGFIESAKEESIEAILDAIKMKDRAGKGDCDGLSAQRHRASF